MEEILYHLSQLEAQEYFWSVAYSSSPRDSSYTQEMNQFPALQVDFFKAELLGKLLPGTQIYLNPFRVQWGKLSYFLS